MSLMSDVTHQVNHPPTCTSIHHSRGEGGALEALEVFFLHKFKMCANETHAIHI